MSTEEMTGPIVLSERLRAVIWADKAVMIDSVWCTSCGSQRI